MTAPNPVAAIAGPEDFKRYFSVSRETMERLTAYAALLAKWQRTINLVAPSTLPDVWSRHFADSAQLLALAPPAARQWLDIGSGAGFPGLVLAILLAGRGQARMTLIESDTRKAAFLGEVARQTGVAVDIYPERIESAATQAKVESVDVITARALAPMPRLMDLAAAYFSTETVGLFPKGRDADAEVTEARRSWSFEGVEHPSLTDPDGRIVEVRALKSKMEG
jgi:16S rRNA (guanine527-N7)-methyltransferase